MSPKRARQCQPRPHRADVPVCGLLMLAPGRAVADHVLADGASVGSPRAQVPVATHQAAICVRERNPSRMRMRSTCPSAERSSMPSRCPISLFVSPSVTSAATSRCRLVRVGAVGRWRGGRPRKSRAVATSASTSPMYGRCDRPGRTRNPAWGMREAMSRACSSGAARSCLPCMTNVGAVTWPRESVTSMC